MTDSKSTGRRRFWGEAARRARVAAGLSQREVAAAIGRTPAAVGQYEAGRNGPSRRVVAAYAAVLGVPVADLYEGEPPVLPAPPSPRAQAVLDDLDAAGGGRTGWVPDPCEPILVPDGPGRRIICGRMRTPEGRYVLDTLGGS